MMTLVLILVGVIIYAIVMNVMPNNYKNVTLSNYTEEIQKLVEDLEKGLDSSLKLSGTEVVLDGGTLVVTVPLPSAYAIPIDVRSMVEEVF